MDGNVDVITTKGLTLHHSFQCRNNRGLVTPHFVPLQPTGDDAAALQLEAGGFRLVYRQTYTEITEGRVIHTVCGDSFLELGAGGTVFLICEHLCDFNHFSQPAWGQNRELSTFFVRNEAERERATHTTPHPK